MCLLHYYRRCTTVAVIVLEPGHKLKRSSNFFKPHHMAIYSWPPHIAWCWETSKPMYYKNYALLADVTCSALQYGSITGLMHCEEDNCIYKSNYINVFKIHYVTLDTLETGKLTIPPPSMFTFTIWVPYKQHHMSSIKSDCKPMVTSVIRLVDSTVPYFIVPSTFQ